MLFKRIESEGLAHYSYLIGDNGEAAVIDPRRDCSIYIEEAVKRGFRIKNIFETHCNEDYVIGSLELSSQTRAEIWHADFQWDYRYGYPVHDGQLWKIGRLMFRALSTPGHTPGHMSYLLHDVQNNPWVVFTGDALFAGEVGRVDLLGMDRAPEMAGILYDTLFDKLLKLPDGVIVCPAHGTGSVCGNAISERPWTTIGLERSHNPKLQYKTKEEFIAATAQELDRPPYFTQMEKLNREGPPLLGQLPVPLPLSPADFNERIHDSVTIDTRMVECFGEAHVPGAQSIWCDGLPGFAGWFLPYDKPILMINGSDDPDTPVRYLVRIGYDKLEGYLSGGMYAWNTAGFDSNSINTITIQELCRLLDEHKKPWILDVRTPREIVEAGEIPGGHLIEVVQLPHRMNDVPHGEPVYIICGSGLRSMIAASYLARHGWKNLTVILGGMSGWNSINCPVKGKKERETIPFSA